MSQFTKSTVRTEITPGDSVRIAREMMGWSQNKLSEESGLPQSTISGIEKNRITVGVERAKQLAIALNIHPSVIVFPQWRLASRRVKVG